jgi:hypothetical protein
MILFSHAKGLQVKSMKEKKERKTTLVRVTLETKANIDALCKSLKWDQQTVVDEAVKRVIGKLSIRFDDDPKPEPPSPVRGFPSPSPPSHRAQGVGAGTLRL